MSEGIGGNGGVQLDENVTGVSGVEWHNLDYGASALVLTYLDSESLCRSEAVSKSFKESVGNAWTVLAIEKGLVEDVVVVPPRTWNFHTLSLCLASRYAKEVANMSDEDMRSEGRLLSVLHPSSDDYDFFIRFSSGGDALLSEGFFSPVNTGSELVPMLDQTFHLGDADLSQWSAMEEFLTNLGSPGLTRSITFLTRLCPRTSTSQLSLFTTRPCRPPSFSERMNSTLESQGSRLGRDALEPAMALLISLCPTRGLYS